MSEKIQIQKLRDSLDRVTRACEWRGEKLQATEARITELEAALEFYADRSTWRGSFPHRPIDHDCDGDFAAVQGRRARQALASDKSPVREAERAVVEAAMAEHKAKRRVAATQYGDLGDQEWTRLVDTAATCERELGYACHNLAKLQSQEDGA